MMLTKEDYMKLPKERLAELLVERDMPVIHYGRDLWECSAIAAREGRQKAIEPGEPADLVLRSLLPAYRKLGRDRIIELIKEGKTEKEIKAIARQKPL